MRGGFHLTGGWGYDQTAMGTGHPSGVIGNIYAMVTLRIN